MPNPRIPAYFKWREGRPRWEPGPRLRAKGWKGRDLRDDAGTWLPLGQAITAAEAINAQVAAWRAEGMARRAPKVKPTARTGADLAAKWQASPGFGLLAASTQADYRQKLDIFLASEFGRAPIAAVGRGALKGWWETLYRERGHAQANGVLAVVRSMLTYATDLEWIATNPAFRLKLRQTAPRQVLWLPEEVAAFVAAGDALGAAGLADAAEAADAVIVALHSGQRLGDVIRLPERIFDEQRLRLSQMKRGARIDAPMTPQLLARVAAIRARRGTRDVIALDAPLLTRTGGALWTRHSLNRAVRVVRDEAARRGAGTLAAGIAGRTFQDLRDTAVTRLALAGCDLAEIAAITGHSTKSIASIIKHYLVLQPAMAVSAIGKLQAWLAQQGIEI